MDLSALHELADDRSERWRQAGVKWKVVDGPPTDKPAAWLVLTVGDLVGDLVLWLSGEAEMTWGTREHGEQRHFDIASRDQLGSCVDELEESLGVA